MVFKMEDLLIMKFGGSCLIDSRSFNQIIRIISKYKERNKMILVNSAINGITNKLIEFYIKSCNEDSECSRIIEEIYTIHEQLIKRIIPSNKEEFQEAIEFLNNKIEDLKQLGRVITLIRPSPDIQDLIISYGETLSTFILTQYLNSNQIDSKFLQSNEIIITNDLFGNAIPLLEDTEPLIHDKLVPLLESKLDQIICITGFYGSTKDKKISTMGRGGSDLTAAILAYGLRNKFNSRVIYWKDVKGFLDADPRIARKTSLIQQISYIEAKELTFFGAKILHPLCLDINEKGNILSEIRSFREPDSAEYTTITKGIDKNGNTIKAITAIYKLSMVIVESDTMVPLPGTASKLFSLLGENNVNIVFITQSSSENNITLGIDYEDSKKVSFLLRNSEFFGKQWFRIILNNEISLIAIIGAGILYTPGVAGKVFTTLGENNINILAIAQGSSELSFTAIIERKNCERAVNVLYDIFIG